MKKVKDKNKYLFESIKADLRKHNRSIVKSFRYINNLIILLKKLVYYIVKLIKSTGFFLKLSDRTFNLYKWKVKVYITFEVTLN